MTSAPSRVIGAAVPPLPLDPAVPPAGVEAVAPGTEIDNTPWLIGIGAALLAAFAGALLLMRRRRPDPFVAEDRSPRTNTPAVANLSSERSAMEPSPVAWTDRPSAPVTMEEPHRRIVAEAPAPAPAAPAAVAEIRETAPMTAEPVIAARRPHRFSRAAHPVVTDGAAHPVATNPAHPVARRRRPEPSNLERQDPAPVRRFEDA